MIRSNLLAVVSFAAVFAAGFFVARSGIGGAGGGGGADPWLAGHLGLTPSQQEAVRKIWVQQLNAPGTDPAARWLEAERERDAEVEAILTPDQRVAYRQIVERHRARAERFRADVLRSQHDAEEKTKSLLNPAQRQKFERLVEERARRQAAATTNEPVPSLPVQDVRTGSFGGNAGGGR